MLVLRDVSQRGAGLFLIEKVKPDHGAARACAPEGLVVAGGRLRRRAGETSWNAAAIGLIPGLVRADAREQPNEAPDVALVDAHAWKLCGRGLGVVEGNDDHLALSFRGL